MAGQTTYPRYTVSTITAGIKQAIENGYTRVIVDGEISGFRRYPSGHCYFTLKDSGAQMQAVMFKSSFERCPAKDGLQDGAKVSVFGNVTVYEPRGNYQITVLSAKIAGVGDLMRQYLELKAKLEAEGLFDVSKKRPLPYMPRRIGIVTSEAGAVIHDMCTVLTRRFANLEIRLYPSMVQGEGAAETLIRGVDYFQREWNADLLIIARGGGSFEDLFCFNDERLARTIAASKIPVISAVGHETDFTICDFVADRRAGTPSIAAEIAVPVKDELLAQLLDLRSALATSLRAKGEYAAQKVDHLTEALFSSLSLYGERMDNRLDRALAKLTLLSPYGVLERGYSITTTAEGVVVKDSSELKSGQHLSTRFARGEAESVLV